MKNPSSQGRRETPRYHPASAGKVPAAAYHALTGVPDADYSIHQRSLSMWTAGEFGLMAFPLMPLKGFHLAFPSR
ncbi:MAG: hypothetical protein ACUVRJ_04885 [Candidatus Villigracilaceae bacterium]